MPFHYNMPTPRRPNQLKTSGMRAKQLARQAFARRPQLAQGVTPGGRAQARLGDLLQAAAPPTMAGRLRVAGPPRRGSRTVMT